MNMVAFFLAQRIMLSHTYQKNISTMTIICFSGIFIGSFSLALITAIMNGFEVVIYEKMQGIHANLVIQTYNNNINVDALTSVLSQEFPEVIASSPMATQHILLRTPNQSENTPIVGIIKGIDPLKETHTSSLSKKITHPSLKTKFSDLFQDNQIIIGKQMAYNNNLIVGDTVELLFIRDEQIKSKKITFDSKPAIISGIFDTGIDEFDNGVIYSSLLFLEELFPNFLIEQINLSIHPHTNEKHLIQKLQNRLGLDVYSWKDLYPSLVATLKLEKYVAFFIIAIILLVACMNIISVLFMQITQKWPQIALLKSMGMPQKTINAIFFIIGITISCTASLLGLLTACIVSALLQHYPFITLPDTYYVTELPVAMNFQIVCTVFGVVLFFSLLATWLPIRYIRTINISRVLRFEG